MGCVFCKLHRKQIGNDDGLWEIRALDWRDVIAEGIGTGTRKRHKELSICLQLSNSRMNFPFFFCIRFHLVVNLFVMGYIFALN